MLEDIARNRRRFFRSHRGSSRRSPIIWDKRPVRRTSESPVKRRDRENDQPTIYAFLTVHPFRFLRQQFSSSIFQPSRLRRSLALPLSRLGRSLALPQLFYRLISSRLHSL